MRSNNKHMTVVVHKILTNDTGESASKLLAEIGDNYDRVAPGARTAAETKTWLAEYGIRAGMGVVAFSVSADKSNVAEGADVDAEAGEGAQREPTAHPHRAP